MKFSYQARNNDGQIKQGFVVAATQAKAEQLLAENAYIIISLKLQRESFLLKLNPFGRHISYKEIVIFSRQFSTLIAARVPILQTLRILEGQITNKKLGAVVRDLITSIENGESLSLGLSKHPETFSNVYISLVKSGEASGAVADALNYLSDQLEKDYELRSKVKSALTYPIFVLAALGGVGFLMFKFVLPNLTAVLKEQGGQLPTISQILISLTDFFQVFWWLVLLILAGLIVGFRFYIYTTAGRYQWDRLKIHLPILGDVFRKIYLARFSRNLSTLVAGGLPIIKAIRIISEVINNVVYRDILLDVADQVTVGKTISESLAKYPEFPPLVTQMVKVGEQSAQLDNILGKLANFYEKEVDAKVATLATLLEPLIMIILGIGVGALVAGILLPIYNLASTTG